MIAKVIVRGVDRADAIGRMLRALGEFRIDGVTTLIGFHRALLSHPCFRAGETCEGVVESSELTEQAEQLSHRTTSVARPPDGALSELATEVEIDGRRVAVKVLNPEPAYRALARRRRERGAGAAAETGSGTVRSPMQGTVIDVKIAEGDAIASGDVVCIVEAMKMENEITAHRDGVVVDVLVDIGMAVSIGQPICAIGDGTR